jgi:hypothetical protein
VSEALCRTIREAFAGVALGGGIGLHQAQGLDDYDDATTCAHLRAGDEKDDWSRITAEELNRCNSSLSFFDAEGMRFHIPVFMIAELQGRYRFGMAFSLTHLSDDSVGKFGLLSPAQRQAVRSFLLHLAEIDEYRFERADILRALEEYWVASP